MSVSLLFRMAVAGLLLSMAALLGAKVRPGVETPIVLAARTVTFGLVAAVFVLCVAENLGVGPSPELLINTIAARVRVCTDTFLAAH